MIYSDIYVLNVNFVHNIIVFMKPTIVVTSFLHRIYKNKCKILYGVAKPYITFTRNLYQMDKFICKYCVIVFTFLHRKSNTDYKSGKHYFRRGLRVN